MNESFELSEESNALDYLEKTLSFLRQVEEHDLVAWKWVMISIHGAIYGFGVAAARGTNWDAVTYVRNDQSRALKGFDEILKLCENPTHMRMLVDSKPLQLTAEQRKSIEYLKDQLRNEFQHFLPRHWVLFVEGLPRITYRALEVVHYLALETRTYVHLSSEEMSTVASLVNEGFEICERLRRRYKSAI
ncbi:MAG TPA: hypothetical protein VIG64_02900 [Actinomycetota bacterium]|jgi:hypothetical protein